MFKGTDLNFFEIYNASEGFFGMQDQNESNELLLMVIAVSSVDHSPPLNATVPET